MREFKKYQNVLLKSTRVYRTGSLNYSTSKSRYSSKKLNDENNQLIKNNVAIIEELSKTHNSVLQQLITLSDDATDLFNNMFQQIYDYDLKKLKKFHKGSDLKIIAPIGAFTKELLLKVEPDKNNDNLPSYRQRRSSYDLLNAIDLPEFDYLSVDYKIFIQNAIKRMRSLPIWSERLLYHVLATNEFLSDKTIKSTITLSEYIVENDKKLYDEVFMKFNITEEYDHIESLNNFYRTVILESSTNIDDDFLDFVEQLTVAEYKNILEYTFNHHSDLDRYGNKTITYPRNADYAKDFINFAKVIKSEENFYTKNLEIVWQESLLSDSTINKETKDLLQQYWDTWMKRAIQNRHNIPFNNIYIHKSVEVIERNSNKLSSIQLFSLLALVAESGILYRSSDSEYNPFNIASRTPKITHKILSHHEKDIVDFANYIEELVFKYDGTLPAPTEWEQGYEELSLEELKMIPMSMLQNLIKIYDRKPVRRVPPNLRKLRKDIAELENTKE